MVESTPPARCADPRLRLGVASGFAITDSSKPRCGRWKGSRSKKPTGSCARYWTSEARKARQKSASAVHSQCDGVESGANCLMPLGHQLARPAGASGPFLRVSRCSAPGLWDWRGSVDSLVSPLLLGMRMAGLGRLGSVPETTRTEPLVAASLRSHRRGVRRRRVASSEEDRGMHLAVWRSDTCSKV